MTLSVCLSISLSLSRYFLSLSLYFLSLTHKNTNANTSVNYSQSNGTIINLYAISDSVSPSPSSCTHKKNSVIYPKHRKL